MLILLIFSPSQKAEQIEEEVDEVQIELKRRENGRLTSHVRIMRIEQIVGLDILGIVGGQHQENGDAGQAVEAVHPLGKGEQQGEQGKNQQKDQPCHQNGPQPEEVGLGKIAIERQAGKVDGGGGKDQDQAPQIEEVKIEGKDDPCQGGIGEKEYPGRRDGQALDAGGQDQHHGQLRHQRDDGKTGNKGIGINRDPCDIPGQRHQKGRHQAEEHPEKGLRRVGAHGLHPAELLLVAFVAVKIRLIHRFAHSFINGVLLL